MIIWEPDYQAKTVKYWTPADWAVLACTVLSIVMLLAVLMTAR